ncbi:MAG: type II toxin-antitoxin system VapC family toxin [Candidatus Dormibacteraeota bacterium]|nr:type II toxin-antitoxin system VapC family toxin [Candidatus Dormibacteraeota bacterium]
MRLLLDTHVLLWWLADDPSLDVEARRAIASGDAEVSVSAASAWEIAIKKALGKLQAPDDLAAQLEHHRFLGLPITIAHALAAGRLPPHHADPFDRMLVAQAIAEGLTIVTRDARIAAYGVTVLAG